MSDLRYFITLVERWETLGEAIEPMSDKDIWQRGYEDGLKGEADWAWVGMGRPNEEVYFQGYKHGKEERPQAKPTRQAMPRIPIPTNLKGIKRSDLNAAYTMLVAGHATDNVQNIARRDPEDAVEAITDALANLSERFVNGTITLYRTIRDDDPDGWVKRHMRSTQRLGRFWSSDETMVMAHADEERVLFCVDAPVAAVDWPETIVLTVDGVEAEIRLRDGAAVTLQYVEPAAYEFEPQKRQMA